MNINASEEEIAAARAYEGLHVPALFRQWAPHVAEAARIRRGQRVLDVACGTGILAREAAKRVGNAGYVSGVDPGAGMLAVAESLAPSIDWRPGTAESLPCENESFDAVVSQFGLMFFNDRAGALREMLRVLVPGGRCAIAVWDSLENTQAYSVAVELLNEEAGQQAADALRAPFVMGDREALSALLDEAGANSIEITTHVGTARFPSIRIMIEAELRGWMPVMGVFLEEAQIEHVLQQAERVLSRFLTSTGTVEFDVPAHIVSAVK